MKDWSKILLTPEDSIEKSIEVLNAGGIRIALVVDNDGKLLGTLTDGDIRRSLMKHIDMNCAVKKTMNANPITALGSDSHSLIMLKMQSKDLLHIPIVDEHNVLIGLETLQHLLVKQKYDNPVFLMAGGFGKRLHPLTEDMPKPLLPIGNQPILEIILMQFIEAGFHNFYISIYYKGEKIREHFGDGSQWGVTIKYVHEDKPLGTAGSLGMLPEDIVKLPILVMNGDLLTKVDFIQLLHFHNKKKCIATMCVREHDVEVPYGVVTIENENIQSLVEKPIQKFFINAGIYVLDPSLIVSLDGLSYIDMTSLLEDRISNGECVSVFPVHEYWMDIGRVDEYKNASKEYFNKFLND